MRIILMESMLAAGLLLSACGDSKEDASKKAYNRGYDDGVSDVCNEIYRFSNRMFETLQDQRIC